jgi:hypothetical protein
LDSAIAAIYLRVTNVIERRKKRLEEVRPRRRFGRSAFRAALNGTTSNIYVSDRRRSPDFHCFCDSYGARSTDNVPPNFDGRIASACPRTEIAG